METGWPLVQLLMLGVLIHKTRTLTRQLAQILPLQRVRLLRRLYLLQIQQYFLPQRQVQLLRQQHQLPVQLQIQLLAQLLRQLYLQQAPLLHQPQVLVANIPLEYVEKGNQDAKNDSPLTQMRFLLYKNDFHVRQERYS